MSRYIYDEVKKEFLDDWGIELNPNFIIKCMAKVTHEMGYRVPGMIPEDRIEEFKQKVKDEIEGYIRRIGSGVGWLNSLRNLNRS